MDVGSLHLKGIDEACEVGAPYLQRAGLLGTAAETVPAMVVVDYPVMLR